MNRIKTNKNPENLAVGPVHFCSLIYPMSGNEQAFDNRPGDRWGYGQVSDHLIKIAVPQK
jgi:hypothetical protein